MYMCMYMHQFGHALSGNTHGAGLTPILFVPESAREFFVPGSLDHHRRPNKIIRIGFLPVLYICVHLHLNIYIVCNCIGAFTVFRFSGVAFPKAGVLEN